MTSQISISNVRFSAGTPEMIREGLLGWVAVTVNDTIRLDGIALRRTRDGRQVLSFPARRDHRGRQHSLIAPIDDDSRLDIERQVFQSLGVESRRTAGDID